MPRNRILSLSLWLISLWSSTSALTMTEPNPPSWPDSVHIIRETDDAEGTLQRARDAAQDSWSEEHQSFTADQHFSSRRQAVLMAPGTYRNWNLQIGYYTQLAGLGSSPDDVVFEDGGPFVPALNRHLHEQGTCLDTFWRSLENVSVKGNMQWAVSQAAPLRNVHVHGDLLLHDAGAYASGGHLANSRIDGQLQAGGQQQFLVRHCDLKGGATGGAWSMVYLECSGDVPSGETSGQTAVTVVDSTKVRMEKPYVALKDDTKFELRVPVAIFEGKHMSGPLWENTQEIARDFSGVRVIRPDDPVSKIQEALDQGKDVVLSPGIYDLEETLEMKHPNQVLLGLGLATVTAPVVGGPCIHVASGVPGVRIAGLMLEAPTRIDATTIPSSLLDWGDEGKVDAGLADNPGGLFDIFCRVGGTNYSERTKVSAETMMRIHSGHVLGDNLWLWRADHGALAENEEANYKHISPIFWQSEEDEYRVETGIEVNGDDVTVYGLAVEHANGHQTVWKGNRGSVVFYQCELPYDVSQDYAAQGYRGYKVHDSVEEHSVYAPGVYSNFRNADVRVATAMELPDKATVVNPFIVKLDNQGGIDSIVNGKGAATTDEQGIPIRF